MPKRKPTIEDFQSAIIEHVRANAGDSPDEAVAATLPDYLSWDASGYHGATRAARCGGGDPPECAGFDTFELDRKATPAWAVEEFERLPEDAQERITTEAEEAEIDRREP